jgi:hypothetical protein
MALDHALDAGEHDGQRVVVHPATFEDGGHRAPALRHGRPKIKWDCSRHAHVVKHCAKSSTLKADSVDICCINNQSP